MSKRNTRTNRTAEHGDFAGPNADQANIERLAAAAAAANAKAGHNSGEPPKEVIERNFNAIEVCLIEIDAAAGVMAKARQALGAAEKTAKTDTGSKAWADSIKEAVKKKRAAAKGGASDMVTEHRQIGYVLRMMDVPLYTQFGLFNMPDEAEIKSDPAKSEAEATLAGEKAGREGQPMDNCPHTPGTPEAFAWRNAWQRGFDAAAEALASGDVATA